MKKSLALVIFIGIILSCDTIDNKKSQFSSALAIWANLQVKSSSSSSSSTSTSSSSGSTISDITPPTIERVELMKNNVFVDIVNKTITLEWNWFKQPLHIRLTADEPLAFDTNSIKIVQDSKDIIYDSSRHVTFLTTENSNSVYIYINSLPDTCLLSYWTITIKAIDINGNISEDLYILKLHIIGD